MFKSSKHPKEAAEFAIWLNSDPQGTELLIKGAGGFPAKLSLIDLPLVSGPQPFFGNQAIGQVFKDGSTHVDANFQ